MKRECEEGREGERGMTGGGGGGLRTGGGNTSRPRTFQVFVSLYPGCIYPDAEAEAGADACITGCLAAGGKLNQARLDFEKKLETVRKKNSAKAATFSVKGRKQWGSVERLIHFNSIRISKNIYR